MRTETVVFYTLAMVLCGVAVILTACKRADYGALVSSLVILMLVISLAMTSGSDSLADATTVIMPANGDEQPVTTPPPAPASSSSRMQWSPQVYSPNAVAHVTNNAYVGPTFSPPPVNTLCDTQLLLPVTMEGQCPKYDNMRDNIAQCGGGYKLVPNMPPMPGLAQLSGNAVWRLPEYPVEQSSREETIAAVVSDLPTCCQTTPKDMIRNQGLYGIKGNLSCDLLKRSAVSDHGFLEPLAARNAFLAFNSYDQLHAKDQYLIPVNKKQPE
jgi:hypothetical protein